MSARDLRRASLRGALFVAALYAAGLLAGQVGPVWLTTCAFGGVLVTILAVIELRGAGRAHGSDPSEPFVVWIAAGLGLALLFVQAHYVHAVLTTRSFEVALDQVWHQVWVVGSPFQVALALVTPSCPFALAAHVRLRGYEPSSTVSLTALLVLLPAGCVTLGLAFPLAAAAVVLLLCLYWGADRLEERLWSGVGAAERALADALPHRLVWLQAYLGHPPAAQALGLRAPEAPADLERFMLNLEFAGRATAVRAATVVARLVVPFLDEARRDDPTPRAIVAALEAWLLDPTPAARDAVRALLDGWAPERVDPAARALREAAFALEGEPPAATRLAVHSAARAAALAGEVMGSPADVREAVRQALLERALAEAARGPTDAPA